MAIVRHTIQTGKKDPRTSTEGARPQPPHNRQIVARQSGFVLGVVVFWFIVEDRPVSKSL
jgi:hypothetical protein